MTPGRLSIMIAAALSLLLAGCAAPATGEPSSSASPTASATAVGNPLPSVRVPLDCADLVDAAELSSLTGATLPAVDASVDAPATLESFAALQYGALDCAWSTEPLATDLAVPVVTITVVPDVTTERWAEFVPLMGGEGTQRAGFGADSYVVCAPPRFDGSSCQLNNLVGDYWLSVIVSAPDGSISLDTSAPVFDTATSVILAAAGPNALRWISPGADASTLDPATAATALTAPVYEVVQDTLSPQRGARWLPMAETDMSSAVYSSSTADDGSPADFTLQVLPSGAWALAALSGSIGDASSVDGVGDAAIAYPTPDGTAVVYTDGDDLVLLDVFSSGTGDETDRATVVAKAVAAALR